MKFFYDPYAIKLEWEENENCVLLIENQKAYIDLLSDLYNQVTIGEGDAVLSDGENVIDMRKYVELINEPFSLELNNRKIKSRLYQDLSSLALQELFTEYNDVCAKIQAFTENVLALVPYSTTFESEFLIEDLLKVENVSLDYAYESIAEKIIVYIKLMASACNIHSFFCVDIARFLSKKEIDELIKEAQYSKVNIIMINSFQTKCIPEGASRYLLDDTLCFF